MGTNSEPYRPPAELRRVKRSSRPWQALIWASLLWFALSGKVLMARMFLFPILVEFEVELPMLTRACLHPMATVFVLSTTAMIVGSAILLEDAGKRIRLGRIATVIGMIAIAGFAVGLLMPLLSLMTSLAS